MLMGLGSLATIGVQKPDNLAIVVFDNGLYGETGMQESHTQGGVDLCEVARGCGIERVLDIEDEAGLKELAGLLRTSDRTLFARVRITARRSAARAAGKGRRRSSRTACARGRGAEALHPSSAEVPARRAPRRMNGLEPSATSLPSIVFEARFRSRLRYDGLDDSW